jgi:hypothetical protein
LPINNRPRNSRTTISGVAAFLHFENHGTLLRFRLGIADSSHRGISRLTALSLRRELPPFRCLILFPLFPGVNG